MIACTIRCGRLALVLPIRDRTDDAPPDAEAAEVRSTLASPANKTLQVPGSAVSKFPLATALPVGHVAPTSAVAVLVVVSVTAGSVVVETSVCV